MAPSSRGNTAVSACDKVETDSFNMSLLANSFAVTIKVAHQCYKYEQQFAE